jgi:hypothetical protein
LSSASSASLPLEEREIASLKERVGSLQADLRNLPDLIRIDIRLSESRLTRRLHSLETELDDFRTHVDQRFEAMLRAMAEGHQASGPAGRAIEQT